MDVKAYVLLLVGIVIGVVGQLLLKYSMSRRPSFRVRDLAQLARDLPVVGGFCCYVIATLLYLKVLAQLDLSVAYPTVGLGYVLILITSRLFFEEPVTLVRWVAVVLICAGVAMVGIGSG